MKKAVAWVMFVGGSVGFALSAFRVIARTEPLLVLLLSWGALVFEGMNAVFINDED